AVLWKAAIVLGITGAISSSLGAFAASHLPGKVLKTIFGIAILGGAIRMLTAKPPKIEEKPLENVFTYVLWGIPLGFACGLIGIGGGVLMVPVMVVFLRFSMHQAVGTSTAMMIFTSIGGVISYVFEGLNVNGLPDYSIGYVNLLQWILLAGTSIPMAQVGVRAAHKLPARKLKYIFIAVMIYMALKMIGVFSWLHLPI
ncbi:MAG: sulfite exporter TauE/SafE family protein, partial [Thermoproteota archaeon]